MSRRKMPLEILEGRDHVLLRAEAGGVRVRLGVPKVLGGEELLLLVRCVAAAAYEQHPLDGRVARVFREDVALHDDAIRGVEWRREPEPLSQNALGKAVFREKSAQQL